MCRQDSHLLERPGSIARMDNGGSARRRRANLAIGAAWTAWGFGLLWVLQGLLSFALGLCPPYRPGDSALGTATRQWAPPGLECTYSLEGYNAFVRIEADSSLLVGLLLVVALPTYMIAKRSIERAEKIAA